MGRFTAATATIISIYPISPEPQERFVGPTQDAGRTLFKIEGAPKGEYRKLIVPDMFRRERDWNYTDRDPEAWKSVLESCDVLANDLVNSWTNALIGARESGGRPGIGIYEGEVPGGGFVIEKLKGRDERDEQFRVFLAALRASQDLYFEYLFYDGQKLAQNNEWKQITALHRTAATYLGKEEKWIKPESSDSMKDCPACFARVDARAWVCPNCRQQIAERPKHLQEFALAGAK